MARIQYRYIEEVNNLYPNLPVTLYFPNEQGVLEVYKDSNDRAECESLIFLMGLSDWLIRAKYQTDTHIYNLVRTAKTPQGKWEVDIVQIPAIKSKYKRSNTLFSLFD